MVEKGADKTAQIGKGILPNLGYSGQGSFPWMPLLNLIAALVALGSLYYVKVVFKRPAITDSGERARIAAEHQKPQPPPVPAYIQFPSQTINIEATPSQPKAGSGAEQIQGKLHFVTIALSLEIRDSTKQELIETLRPYILDKLNTLMGHKSFHELNSVQGRYLIQAQVLDLTNDLVKHHAPPPAPEGLVTNVYLTEFVVQ